MPSREELENEIKEIGKQIKEIENWFYANDWKVNKIVLGEWTETRKEFVEYKKDRAKFRQMQDELSNLLSQKYQELLLIEQ